MQVGAGAQVEAGGLAAENVWGAGRGDWVREGGVEGALAVGRAEGGAVVPEEGRGGGQEAGVMREHVLKGAATASNGAEPAATAEREGGGGEEQVNPTPYTLNCEH